MSSVFQFSHVILIFMQRSSSRWAHNPRFYTAVIVARIDDSRKENKGNKKIIFVKKKNSSLGRKSELHSCILSKLFFQNFQKSRFESETRRCFNLSQGNRNFSSPGKIREVVTRDKRGLTGRVEKILPPSFSRHQESLVSCSHFHPPPLSPPPSSASLHCHRRRLHRIFMSPRARLSTLVRGSLIFMQRLHDRTRISPGKRFLGEKTLATALKGQRLRVRL